MTTTLEVITEARSECIRPIRNVVASLATETDLSEAQVYAVKVCVSEAVTNVVKHAYPQSDPGPVEVSVCEGSDELEIVVADHGQAYRQQPSVERGGFGLAFVSRFSTRCTFTAASDGTTVEMVFAHPRRRAKRRYLDSGALPGVYAALARRFD
jgi:anti-sigma regulatory factor (Ser/Thr protein kinase)